MINFFIDVDLQKIVIVFSILNAEYLPHLYLAFFKPGAVYSFRQNHALIWINNRP